MKITGVIMIEVHSLKPSRATPVALRHSAHAPPEILPCILPWLQQMNKVDEQVVQAEGLEDVSSRVFSPRSEA